MRDTAPDTQAPPGEGGQASRPPDGAPRRPHTDSGGFGAGAREGESYTFGPGGADLTGPGECGEPPNADLDVAQQLLMDNLGHTFASTRPLAAALTHPSWRNERREVTLDNQRIEFLGDLVLGLAVGETLMRRLPEGSEGELSVLKARLVRESTLAEVAQGLGVGLALRLGRGEARSGGRERPAVLADALEAVFAAVFIDAGYERAREVIARALAGPIEALFDARSQADASGGADLHALTENFKTALQERLAAAGGQAPRYRLISEQGAPGQRTFCVSVEARLDGALRRALGEGQTIKGAENAAAEQLYRVLAPGG